MSAIHRYSVSVNITAEGDASITAIPAISSTSPTRFDGLRPEYQSTIFSSSHWLRAISAGNHHPGTVLGHTSGRGKTDTVDESGDKGNPPGQIKNCQ